MRWGTMLSKGIKMKKTRIIFKIKEIGVRPALGATGCVLK